MATPLVYNYDKIEPYRRNEDFLMKALSYKQQKLDVNRAKLQTLHDRYAMLDIYKDNDKEYAEQRLSQVTDIANKYTAGDLSSDYLTQSLMSNIDQFVDQNVINAVSSTKKFKSEMEEWDYWEKEDPDRYSEQNKNYALSKNKNLQDWINSEKVGQVYKGGSGFIEYINVDEVLNERAQELAKINKWTYVKPVQSDYGFWLDEKNEKVDRKMLENGLRSMISEPKIRQQLDINAWSTYSSQGVDALRDNYNEFYKAMYSSETEKLKKLKTAIKSGNLSSEEEKKAIESRDRIEKDIPDLDKINNGTFFDSELERYGADALSTRLYTDRKLNGLLNTYSYENTLSIEVNKADQEAWKRKTKEEEIEIARFRAMKSASGSKGKSGSVIGPGSGATLSGVSKVVGLDGESLATGGKYLDVEDLTMSYSAGVNAKRRKAVDKMDEVFGKNASAVKNFIVETGSNVNGDLMHLSSIELEDGSTLTLTPEQFRAAKEYKEVVASETPYDIMVDKEYNGNGTEKGLFDSMKESLTVMYQDENLTAETSSFGSYRSSLPAMLGSYKIGDDGKPVWVPLSLEAARVETARVFSDDANKTDKQKKEDKITRDLLTAKLLSQDGDLEEGIRSENRFRYSQMLREYGVRGGDYIKLANWDIAYDDGGTGDEIENKLNRRRPTYYDANYNSNISDITNSTYESPSGDFNLPGLTKGTPPSQLIKSYQERIIEGAGELHESGKLLPMTQKYTWTKDIDEQKDAFHKLKNVISGNTEIGSSMPDGVTSITVEPVYNLSKNEPDSYILKYGVDNQNGKGKVATGIPLNLEVAKKVLEPVGIKVREAPIVSSRLEGSNYNLGTFKPYVDERSNLVKNSNRENILVRNEVVGFLNSIDESVKMYASLKGQSDDKESDYIQANVIDKLNDFKQSLLTGDIEFRVESREGKVVVNLFDKGEKSVIYTDEQAIERRDVYYDKISDKINVAQIKLTAAGGYMENVILGGYVQRNISSSLNNQINQ